MRSSAVKVRISVAGTSPLLMHNIRLANPRDPITRQIASITKKTKKTDEDHELIALLEWEGGLYYDPSVGPYIPGPNIEQSIREGGTLTRSGQKVERGLFVIDDVVPVLYEGTRDIDKLKTESRFASVLAVGIGSGKAKKRVMRCRPLFVDWSLDVEASLDTSQLSVEDLGSIVEDAGAHKGLGDYRPRYGRYEATVVQL